MMQQQQQQFVALAETEVPYMDKHVLLHSEAGAVGAAT
jgi:hypothetical protein